MKSLTKTYMQQKRKTRKGSSVSTLSLLRRELREGNLQSLFGGSSYLLQPTNAAPDPLLSSFILPIGDDLGSTQSNSLAESVAVTKSTTEKASERYVLLLVRNSCCIAVYKLNHDAVDSVIKTLIRKGFEVKNPIYVREIYVCQKFLSGFNFYFLF